MMACNSRSDGKPKPARNPALRLVECAEREPFAMPAREPQRGRDVPQIGTAKRSHGERFLTLGTKIIRRNDLLDAFEELIGAVDRHAGPAERSEHLCRHKRSRNQFVVASQDSKNARPLGLTELHGHKRRRIDIRALHASSRSDRNRASAPATTVGSGHGSLVDPVAGSSIPRSRNILIRSSSVSRSAGS